MRRRAVVANGMFAISVAVLLLTAAGPRAQDAPQPAYRVTTELVVVDLIATDRAHNFVADLQPSDIRVLEDGKPQKVAFVRLVQRETQAATAAIATTVAPAPATPAMLPPSAASGAGPSTADPIRIIVVVDLVTTPADEFPRVKDAIVRMLREELPAGPEVMLVALWHGLTVQQSFTSDRQKMIGAVQSMPTPLGERLSFMQMMDSAQQLCESGLPPLPQLIGMGKAFINETRQDLTAASAALGALARASGALPGRKHIVLYSRGYAFNAVGHVIEMVAGAAATCGGDAASYRRTVAQELSGAADFDADAPLQALIDDANRSQVSFYTIDPRGLMVTSVQARDAFSARAGRGALTSRTAALDATLPQDYLRVVAGDTGGRVFLNTNDLTQGLKRAWIDASEYYLVGYVPPAARKAGRYHRIEVKTERPDLDLRFRRGYYDSTEKDLLAADVKKALSLPGVFDASGLEIDARLENGTLHVVAYLPPAMIAFTRASGINTADVALHAILRDEKGTWVGGKALFGRDIALRLNDEQLAALLSSDNVEIPVKVSAPPPGRYQLTVVARDSGGWIGARVMDLVR